MEDRVKGSHVYAQSGPKSLNDQIKSRKIITFIRQFEVVEKLQRALAIELMALEELKGALTGSQLGQVQRILADRKARLNLIEKGS